MRLGKVSPEAEEVLELPFTPEDAEACSRFLNRFECSTTALYLIGATIATEFENEAAAEIIAEAVVKLAEHEAKTR